MEGGNPKIADFGLAGVMAPFNAGGFTLQCGTPEFTAPEIVEGKEYEGPAVSGVLVWAVMLYSGCRCVMVEPTWGCACWW
jgi:serine/threonine protein kinase